MGGVELFSVAVVVADGAGVFAVAAAASGFAFLGGLLCCSLGEDCLDLFLCGCAGVARLVVVVAVGVAFVAVLDSFVEVLDPRLGDSGWFHGKMRGGRGSGGGGILR